MKCLNCEEEFEVISVGGNNKKFCCTPCKDRYNARNRHYKISEEEKEKKKNYFKEWYKLNKEKHNLKMRFYMRGYYHKNYSKKALQEKEKDGKAS